MKEGKRERFESEKVDRFKHPQELQKMGELGRVIHVRTFHFSNLFFMTISPPSSNDRLLCLY